ncbi:BON domain-containing protein [Streptomyces solicathayae]|uniref:BON domain-containing protein n=1 Tax=Streptomyces solicathayae TaxID=3081768 RepID=A0ABZ0LLV9_9ACTN|nr:BON domain-containing protein [Streptomyces sp. HUAS YS2]WOX20416.1 BON domain-containing protein [Streptomyces sp. HUAS YS2]
MPLGEQAAYPVEYRIEHLRERLAKDDMGELGVRVELRGATVLLVGVVQTAERRDEILRLARAELAGVPVRVRADLVLSGAGPPARHEELW